MNKKLIVGLAALAIIITALVILITKDKSPSDTDTTASSVPPLTVNLESETKENSEDEKKKDYDSKITVVLPIEFVDAKYGDDLDAFVKDNGYFSARKQGKDKVKIKMREYSYKLILTSVGMETIKGIGATVDSQDYEFSPEIEKYDSDFGEIIISVNKDTFLKSENKDDFFNTLAFYCLYYRSYVNDLDKKCSILICEKNSNVVLEAREITADSLQQQMSGE